MHKVLLVLFVTGLSFLFAVASPASRTGLDNSEVRLADHKSGLLETGGSANSRLAMSAPSEIKIVSYNIRWRSGTDLHQLAKLLLHDAEIGGAAILGLQEVDRNKKRSGNKNSAAILAHELGMHYAWAAPPAAKSEKEEETGVAILSAYPLTDVHRLVLPKEGPGGRRRAAVGATLKLGKTDLRVYSVHAETRIPVECKLEQMKAVLNDLACYDKNMPAIVLGDFNTWEPSAVEKTFNLFGAAGFETPFDDTPTFFRRALFIPIELKLDWIWLRQLEPATFGIDRDIKLSDHWPLWVVAKTKTSLNRSHEVKSGN